MSENVRKLRVALPTTAMGWPFGSGFGLVELSVYIVIGWPDAGSLVSVGVTMPNEVQSVTWRLRLSVTSRL